MIFGKKLNEWCQWFAWYPVQLNDGRWVLLELVKRKGAGWHYKYRKMKPQTKYEKYMKKMAKELGILPVYLNLTYSTANTLFELWFNGQLKGQLEEVIYISRGHYTMYFNNNGYRTTVTLKE